jgi:hypothetical protein
VAIVGRLCKHNTTRASTLNFYCIDEFVCTAGLVASAVADYYGYVAPFMVSLGLLVLGSVIVFGSWTENYGDSTIDISGTFTNAIHALKQGLAALNKHHFQVVL